MAVNYDDQRFQQVTAEQNQALQNLTNTYNNMINQSQQFYDAQARAAEDYGNQQQALQQQNTDFTIQKIEQQKERAEQDYTKEQKGAYVDWQKQSNRYGVNAEQMASQGLRNGGYSESSQVSMYNQYQNRVGQARESYNRAVQDYDNSITEARLTNSAKLAEIAYDALKTKLELNLNGFQYKNNLLAQQISDTQKLQDTYYNRWQDVLKQINTENALIEEQRQFNEQMALQRQASSGRSYSVSSSSSGGSGGSFGISKDGGGNGQIQTQFYTGSINPDTKYGVFNTKDTNGVQYQPNNVNGKKLSKTGETIPVVATNLNGQKMTVTQNVWKTSDGTKYIWDGTRNQYVVYSKTKSGGGKKG